MDISKYKTMWPEEFTKLKIVSLPPEVRTKTDVIDTAAYAIREDGFYEF